VRVVVLPQVDAVGEVRVAAEVAPGRGTVGRRHCGAYTSASREPRRDARERFASATPFEEEEGSWRVWFGDFSPFSSDPGVFHGKRRAKAAGWVASGAERSGVASASCRVWERGGGFGAGARVVGVGEDRFRGE
jgi:hypothetical protein